MEISVSYLSSIYDKKTTIKLIDESKAGSIHSDIMDGVFVPKKNFTALDVVNDLKDVKKTIDIHLMVDDADKYIDELISLKPRTIIFHIESNNNIDSAISKLKDNNIGVGLSINPATDVDKINKYLKDLDMVLVMSVQPGAGGQRFMFDMLDKIELLNNLRKDNKYNYKINVDGGINEYTAIKCRDVGADIIVSGSYVCHQKDFDKQINNLKR